MPSSNTPNPMMISPPLPQSIVASGTQQVVDKNKNKDKEATDTCNNLEKWAIALTCGTLSVVTCAMCCGMCGYLEPPQVLKKGTYDRRPHINTETICRHHLNVAYDWLDLGCFALTCLPTCGCCCGFCGFIPPRDAK